MEMGWCVQKYSNLKNRLKHKIEQSATPVSGFMLGMSGTDSILTYILLTEVSAEMGDRFSVTGIHYVADGTIDDIFIKYAIPYLNDYHDGGVIHTVTLPRGYHYDQNMWADLHVRAVESVIDHRFWVVTTRNATEKALGTYSILANSASIAPISSLYKSEILELCEKYSVPKKIIDASRIPDCICGRDEFAADNIELIDDVLRNNLTKDYPADMIKKAMDYIRDTKKVNDFKNRTPYNV